MATGHSSKLFEFYEDIECVKLSQSMNNEVIESLSKSISHITSVMSEFQDFLDKNKSNSREAVSAGSEGDDENIEYGNQTYNVNGSIVSEDIDNNGDKCGVELERINQSSDSNGSNGNQDYIVNKLIVSEDINNNGNKCGVELKCINQWSNSNESVPPTFDEISGEIIAGCLKEPKDTELEETYAEVVKSHQETGKTKEKSHNIS